MGAAPSWRYEDEAVRAGGRIVAGLDEVGRGSLAGPVIAAAVVLDRSARIRGINDSKLLTPARREGLAREILETAVAVAVGAAGSEEVDRINVLRATHEAMRRAVEALPEPADVLLLDAVRIPGLSVAQVSLIHGDRLSFSIAAASIVAKVVRDRAMGHYAAAYPEFDFDANKGYGTPAHLHALSRVGPCPIHRRTFRGVFVQPPLALDAEGGTRLGR
jgi:ribonuclease HII